MAKDEVTASLPGEDACVAATSDCKPSTAAVITPQKLMAYIPPICPTIHVIFFLQLVFPLLKTTQFISG